MKRRNSVKVVLVFVLAVVLILCSACQWTPSGEPKGRLMVILSHWGQESQQYELIDLSGRRSDISQTLGVIGMPHRPAAWSPSGERLAYRCGVADDDQSWICDIDVATMTMRKYALPEDGNYDNLTWSADGRSFLFIWGRGYPEPSEVWRLDRTSQQISVLSLLPTAIRFRDWSPDRSQIAFVASETRLIEPDNVIMEKGDVYIQNVDGTSRRMLHKTVGDAKWSPNGETIAFEIHKWPDPGPICWMPVEEGEATCVQEDVGGDPAWAPDGEHIALSGGQGIRVVNTKTGVVQTLVDLTDDDEGANQVSWSPDGKFLAYSKCYSIYANQGCEIYVVSSDGKEHRRLTRNGFADEFPVWQPVVPDTD